MPALSVVIPSYRNPDYLDLCLRSLFHEATDPNSIEAIVVLDGYGQESADVLKKYPDVNVLEFEENRGQMVAHNLGVTNASAEWVLIVNDDNVFPRAWDHRLAAIAGLYPKTIYTVNQIEPAPSIFKSFLHQNFGVTPSEFRHDEFIQYEQEVTDLLPLYDFSPDGSTWPILFEKRHYMMLGGIDQNYPSAAVADWDFFMRAELAGLTMRRYRKVNLYHFAGAATRKKDSNWNEGEARSFEYFQYKWGFMPPMSGYDHSHFPADESVRGVKFK